MSYGSAARTGANGSDRAMRVAVARAARRRARGNIFEKLLYDADVPSGDEQASVPRLNVALSWDAFLSTYLPALVLALGIGIALPSLPTLAKSFGVSFAAASGIVTMFLLGNLAGTLPSGWLIDRFGRRPVMIAGPL